MLTPPATRYTRQQLANTVQYVKLTTAGSFQGQYFVRHNGDPVNTPKHLAGEIFQLVKRGQIESTIFVNGTPKSIYQDHFEIA